MTTYKHVRLGARFAGHCLICGRTTGSRDFELARTSLYQSAEGKHGVVHPICAGGTTKSGGTAYRTAPRGTLDIAQD